jgi:hypothetical protein
MVIVGSVNLVGEYGRIAQRWRQKDKIRFIICGSILRISSSREFELRGLRRDRSSASEVLVRSCQTWHIAGIGESESAEPLKLRLYVSV